jgi:hypothetical protein
MSKSAWAKTASVTFCCATTLHPAGTIAGGTPALLLLLLLLGV